MKRLCYYLGRKSYAEKGGICTTEGRCGEKGRKEKFAIFLTGRGSLWKE